MRYLTWLDVEREVRTQTLNKTFFPEGVGNINCFSDGLEVIVSKNEYIQPAKIVLKQWFGDWLKDQPFGVLLDIGDVLLPIDLLVEEKDQSGAKPENRPLWEDVAYAIDDAVQQKKSFTCTPNKLNVKPTLTAFHSFKGGVGRTTSMTTFVSSLIDYCNKSDVKKKILLIDSDLEAPGISYWFEKSMLPNVSFISFLEAMHYPPKTIDETLKFFADELIRTSINYKNIEIFFIPASQDEAQLLDTPVLPEHIAKSGKYPWLCTDYIHKLGEALDADHIFIDLRAGLSEISSPILFDPRIERFFVTTISEQSVKGTSFILNKVSNFNSNNTWTDNFAERKPKVIVNFLTKELRLSDTYDTAMTQLEASYSEEVDEYTLAQGIYIYESSFLQTFMSFSKWDDAIDKLKMSDLTQLCSTWIEDNTLQHDMEKINSPDLTSYSKSIRSITKICELYEYAEKGESKNLLVTEPIRNLAKHFYDKLPCIVSVGAKGSGKTFNFLQLCSFINWSSFLENVHVAPTHDIAGNIYPLLQSANLEEKALTITENARKQFYKELNLEPHFSPTDLRTIIEDAVSKEKISSKLDWTNFWVNQMSKACCLPNNDKIEILNEFLISKKVKIIFLMDGIEDTFRNIALNEQEQQAVSALLEIPNKILELRTRALGIIIFLREDYLKAVLKQNIGQFVSRYNPYQLSWDAESFLRLVYWICAEAEVIDAKKNDLEKLTQSDLLSKLESLWGRKLGGEKEANTASWVYAALTDLKGKLQARDIIRLLRYASEKSIASTSKSRECLLSPQAIRNALVPCSTSKVDEAKQEYVIFSNWVEALVNIDPQFKKIPFDPVTVGLESSSLETLKDIGVVFEDKDRDEKARFYIPEIYRSGLGFRLDKGARPRVLVLQKRATGNNLI